jgi:hypothetical protein
MLLKCYHYLHPIVESKVGCAYQIVNANSNLDSFEQILNIDELMTKIVTIKLLIFKCYQMDTKIMNCLLQWWGKHETMFPTIGFLTHQS